MASGDILSAIASQKTLEEVKERLGEIGSSGKDISEILEELLLQPKIIKHIQRGFSYNPGANTTTPPITLTGFTNLEKMIVILNGYRFWGSSVYSPEFIQELTLTSLTVHGDTGCSFSYQVIEFC